MRWLCVVLSVSFATATALFGAVSIQGPEFTVFTSSDVQSVSELLTLLGQQQFSAAAWGKFDDTIDSTGWSTLEIHSNASQPDDAQAYGAGVLESSLTLKRTEEFLENMIGSTLGWGKSMKQYMDDNTQWVNDQVKANPSSDYWKLVGLSYRQLQGMYDGYVNATIQAQHTPVSWDMYYSMSLEGDFDDLCSVFKCDGMAATRARKGHCSVLIKITADDLFMGHTTWTGFESMTRIFKLMDLPFSSVPVAAKAVTFSSYPGTIVSVDDWYQTDAGLVITETTIANNNQSLYDKYVVPQTVLYWARNLVANRLSSSGTQWASTFLQHNSGTYNNQWMIFDSKLFNPVRPGLLTVAEQFPGPYVHSEDMTSYLVNNTYWMSYNVPFFPDMFNISNQWARVKAYGDHFTWGNCSRAQLFRSLQSSVVDEASLQKVMRHNDYLRDAVGAQGCKHGHSASNAISERGDLTSDSADCIDDVAPQDEVSSDGKITSWKRLQISRLQTVAQSSPSFDTQPVFEWSKAPSFMHKTPHKGQPDRWDFPWREFSW
jgi:hypothetical protein